MAIIELNDRVELASIFADISSIGGDSQNYSPNFYPANSSLTFTIPTVYVDKSVLSDSTNKVFVEGVNQQTKKRYIVTFNSDANTEYGSDWDEGYYKIYIRQYVKPYNGSDTALSNEQDGNFFELAKKPLYWNRSQISFMTFIQPGIFWMGSPENEIGRTAERERMHYVTISNAFYIARTQMTNNLCNKLLSGSNFGPANEYYNLGTASTEPTTFTSGTTELSTCFATGQTPAWSNIGTMNNNPRINITYAKYNRRPASTAYETTGARGGGNSINGFIKSSNVGYPPPYITGSYMGAETDRSLLKAMETKIHFTSSTGVNYYWDLPTDAQWEYACRAGTKAAFSNGENLKFNDDTSVQPNINEICWYKQRSGGGSIRYVGMLKPNPWGLFDVHGNVYEWCKDWFVENNSALTDGDHEYTGYPSSVAGRVVRGGGYYGVARGCRSAVRNYATPAYAANDCGFRPVLHL